MFMCQVSGMFSKPGEKLNKIVVETREKVYTKIIKNEETNRLEEVEVARGWEIVREIQASERGLNTWNSWTAEERTAFLQHLD